MNEKYVQKLIDSNEKFKFDIFYLKIIYMILIFNKIILKIYSLNYIFNIIKKIYFIKKNFLNLIIY